MQVLRFLFSPYGRLPPQVFPPAAVAVYVAGAASQWLTSPNLIDRAGLWPFVAAQIVLTWIWVALHARRLRDAGRSIDLPVAIALLYALSVALLVIVAVEFVHAASPDSLQYNGATALGLILFVSIITALLGSPQYDVAWLMVTALTAMALLPVILAVACTVWAATRPSVEGQPA
ncbi:MAG TPA: hypothetical protein VEK75_01770 [Xanthobacteraceae bacterium]|nr:hypothetical protein [Xanthobacteraceae bacterium]